jgi:hypothetical protein
MNLLRSLKLSNEKKPKLKIKKHNKVHHKIEDFAGGYPVLIATPVPMIDHKISASLSSFIAGAVARQVALPFTLDSRSPEQARNKIISQFLEDPGMKNHTHICFIDADTMPDNPFAIEKLLMHDKAVTSGITPIGYKHEEKFGMYWNARLEGAGRNLYLDEMPQKLFKSEFVGGSCLLVRRDVLERLEKPYMKAEYDHDQIEFIKGEDYYFCEKIRELVYKIWIDPHVQCHHFHMLDMLEIILMVADYAKNMGDDKYKIGMQRRIEDQDKIMEAMEAKIEEMKSSSS